MLYAVFQLLVCSLGLFYITHSLGLARSIKDEYK